MTKPAENDGKPATPYRYGVPIEDTLERRERFAKESGCDFGADRVFPELISALLAEIPEGMDLLEVGPAIGLLTEELIAKARSLTVIEPSEGMIACLKEKPFSADERLTILQGMAEDLPADAQFGAAVVTFTPRRGMGLLHLLSELSEHVSDLVVMIVDEDASLDWAHLGRAALAFGFDVRLHLVREEGQDAEARRGVVFVADVRSRVGRAADVSVWDFEARVIEVPYPAPRGTATRLIRYLLAGGDRAFTLHTAPEGATRLYGNLRTAAHRLARDEITVRRTDDGIQVVRLPKATE